MTDVDPYVFLKTLITKEESESRARRGATIKPRVVTVSRDFGAKGGTIAHHIADTLGIPLYDREILDRIAAKAKVDAFKLKGHDEDIAAGISTFVFSLLTGVGGELATYRRALYEVVVELAQRDCVLVGRGAHLILPPGHAFRLRVVGSTSVCAQRVAEEEGISLAAAEQRVFEINHKRCKSVELIHAGTVEHCALDHASNFDLVLNTDQIPPERALPVILLAMQEAGFVLQPDR